MVSSKPVSVSPDVGAHQVRRGLHARRRHGAEKVVKRVGHKIVKEAIRARYQHGHHRHLRFLGRSALPGTGRSPVGALCLIRLPGGQLRRIAQRPSSLPNGRQVVPPPFRLLSLRPVQGTVPLNSYRYRLCVSTLQVRVLTRYLHVIFASRCGNLRGRGKPRPCSKRSTERRPPAIRSATAKDTQSRQTCKARHTTPTSAPHLHAAFMLL